MEQRLGRHETGRTSAYRHSDERFLRNGSELLPTMQTVFAILAWHASAVENVGPPGLGLRSQLKGPPRDWAAGHGRRDGWRGVAAQRGDSR